ncbi:MAG: methyltransferase domain-containing protein [Firmicutes bacterium]|nr:methyltransferase domain-containing protein [Bacillota bacterium]
MLRILINKKIEELDNINDLLEQYKYINIDLGTGNGKFVYDLAKKNPNTFYIGIDPTASNLFEYSKKAQKYKIKNIIYIISSIENLNDDLNNLADIVYINFPWGSLLEGIVKDMPEILNKISLLGKSGAEFNFTFAYSSLHEPAEIEKRQLPILSTDYLLSDLTEIYKKANLKIVSCIDLTPPEINVFGTLWSKKLFLGKSRDVFRIISHKI